MAPSESDPQASGAELPSGEIQPPLSNVSLVSLPPDEPDGDAEGDHGASLSREVVATFVSRPATGDWLKAFVRHRVALPHVHDLVQDVLLEALHTTSVPSTEAALPSWMKTIALRAIANHHDKRARRAMHEARESLSSDDYGLAGRPHEPPGGADMRRHRDRMRLVIVLCATAFLALALARLLRL